MIGFKPLGIPLNKTEIISLKFEEYESFKLINYDNLDHETASEKMEISRPTFTRIYNSALKKIATAWVEGKIIQIFGGTYQFEQDWFRCRKCFKLIEGEQNHVKCKNCRVYSSNELIEINKQNELIFFNRKI